MPLATEFLEVVRDLRHELADVRDDHECMLKASEEQEKLIKDLNEKLINKTLDAKFDRDKENPLKGKSDDHGAYNRKVKMNLMEHTQNQVNLETIKRLNSGKGSKK